MKTKKNQSVSERIICLFQSPLHYPDAKSYAPFPFDDNNLQLLIIAKTILLKNPKNNWDDLIKIVIIYFPEYIP